MRTTDNSEGFTLIELLVAVAMVGLLAAIAIPQFGEYKSRSYDARAQTDLRAALAAEEAYYISNRSYLSCGDLNGQASCERVLPGLGPKSKGVMMNLSSYSFPGSKIEFLTASACHVLGAKVFLFGHFDGNSSVALDDPSSKTLVEGTRLQGQTCSKLLAQLPQSTLPKMR